MKNYNRIATVIRLIARIWDSLILLFLLVFVGANAMSMLSGQGGGFNSLEEKLIFFLSFPIGTMIGFSIRTGEFSMRVRHSLKSLNQKR